MKKKLILVPIDFSKCAYNALRHAIHLGKKTNARLSLLHAYQIPVTHGEMGASLIVNDLSNEIIEEIKLDFDRVIKEVPELAGIEYDRVIKHSYVTESILSQEHAQKPDLIVMGTSGVTKILEATLGSNTSSLIQKARCPVLAIPTKAKISDYSSIAFASDYKHTNDEVIEPLVDLANLFKSSIHLIHVDTKPVLSDRELFQALKIKHCFKQLKTKSHFIVNDNVEKGINDYLRGKSIDLLVVIRRKHGFFDQLFNMSWTRKLTCHIKIPILILNENYLSHEY